VFTNSTQIHLFCKEAHIKDIAIEGSKKHVITAVPLQGERQYTKGTATKCSTKYAVKTVQIPKTRRSIHKKMNTASTFLRCVCL
jgi:hypothetical protein